MARLQHTGAGRLSDYAAGCSADWATARAEMFTSRRTVALGVRMCTGFAVPSRIGPTVMPSPWAARAWALDRHESALVEHAARRLGDAKAWQVYRVALADASAALARRR